MFGWSQLGVVAPGLVGTACLRIGDVDVVVSDVDVDEVSDVLVAVVSDVEVVSTAQGPWLRLNWPDHVP
jgi:hypothetical protein